nr:protein FAR1-related sequence 5 [Tanacetum cinerariifolium]
EVLEAKTFEVLKVGTEHNVVDALTKVSSNDSPNEMIQSEETYLASSQFQSRDKLLKGVRAFYWSKGYGLSIRNSRKDKYNGSSMCSQNQRLEPNGTFIGAYTSTLEDRHIIFESKEHAISMINQLVNESDEHFELVIQRPRGRPRKSKKNKGITSTRRDPSRFEIVESSTAHNPSSSTRAFQNNNETDDEFSYIHHDDIFDLNALPDFF